MICRFHWLPLPGVGGWGNEPPCLGQQIDGSPYPTPGQFSLPLSQVFGLVSGPAENKGLFLSVVEESEKMGAENRL